VASRSAHAIAEIRPDGQVVLPLQLDLLDTTVLYCTVLLVLLLAWPAAAVVLVGSATCT
jgi:hypothetical protein